MGIVKPMDCFIPLDSSIPSNDYESLKESHKQRDFIIFDEQLKIVLHISDPKSNITLNNFTVWINDAMMLESNDWSLFDKLDNAGTWVMKPNVYSEDLFRSTVVMNNGNDNHIKFKFKCSVTSSVTVESQSDDTSNELKPEVEDIEDEFLPSFEPIYYWSQENGPAISKHEKAENKEEIDEGVNGNGNGNLENNENEDVKEEIITLEFPIYSLLNMRLRNISLTSNQYIVSSLDFQTSKATTQLSDRYTKKVTNGKPLQFQFDEVLYELLDRNSHIKLEPIIPIDIPFKALTHDSFSICYKLPLVDASIADSNPHRVRVKLIYKVLMTLYQDTDHPLSIELPVLTAWETDVTIKKPTSSALSRVPSTSALSTPRLFGMSKTFGSGSSVYAYSNNNLFQSSVNSLVNNKLNNVKFKFLNNNLQVSKGNKFHMRLQIVNSSNLPLDLVVYYNNNKNSTLGLGSTNNSNSLSNLSLMKKYQIFRKFSKVTEGIILLTNDYKIPLIKPRETYFVDLSFIAIMSGYYSTLSALKVLDLQTNELVEVGLGASILVN